MLTRTFRVWPGFVGHNFCFAVFEDTGKRMKRVSRWFLTIEEATEALRLAGSE